MKLSYTVHSCVEERVSAEVDFQGTKVNALIPGLVVELVCINDIHGHTFRFVSADPVEMAAMKDLFTVGSAIAVNFARG